jgi:hypothetical protein
MNLTIPLLTLLALASSFGCSHSQKHQRRHERLTRSLLIKNDWIEVEKIELAPGKARGMHSGGERLIVALSDYQIQFEEAGSASVDRSWKRGQVHWHAGKPHSVKNTGSTPARFLILTRHGSLPHDEGSKHLSAKTQNPTLLENEWVRVTDSKLKPGGQLAKHPGALRAIVSLSDYEILYNSNCIKNRSSKFRNESVHLHEADEHSLKNIGQTEAAFIIVQFKK